ncbi:tRNA exportin [Novymonas esmeraldas]|uniref:Exportin-T n=1 Tax=Novymonas esmeraldas TaxID=1808958 RepID=A0AAW0F089_9TRYP
MLNAENFTEALRLTHSFDPSVSPAARLEAERYLMSLRESAEGLNLSFHVISNEPVSELRCFWAFNTVMHHLPALAATVDAAQAQELYRTLFAFIHRYLVSSATTTTPTDYVVNKHAQLMVAGLQVFYPARWQSMFDDVFDMLRHRRSGVCLPADDLITVYVLRIFECVDERVVCVRDRQERGKQQRARDMAVKDAMRERVIPQAVHMWYNTLVCDARARHSEVARLCLSVVQTYIEWVDVRLFMTADWINLLYFLVTVPPLRVAACECLLSLVEKKQMPGMKMESLSTLGVVESLPRMLSLLELPPPSEAAVLFTEVVSKFVVAVAGQLLGLLDGCTALAQQTTAAPTSATVIEVDGVVLQDCPFTVTAELLDGLSDALHRVAVAQVMQLLLLRLPEVCEAVLPFIQLYLKSPHLLQSEAAQLLTLLFRHTRVAGVAHDEERVWDDAVIDQRKTLYNLLRLLHRRYPDLVVSHLCQLFHTGLDRLESSGGGGGGGGGGGAQTATTTAVAAAAADGDDASFTSPEVLEAALRYLYEMGEALRLDSLRDAGDLVTQLLQRLLVTEAVTRGDATCVHLAFFEVQTRYYTFFTHHPQYVPLLLQRLLLQPCGVVNRSDRVRARVCYLFGSLLQLLKGQLGPYAADMVSALHSIVCTAPQLQASDRRELYEAMGILLSICGEEGGGGGVGDDGDAGVPPALRLLAASAAADGGARAAVPSAVLAEAAPLLGRKAALLHSVVNSAIHSLQHASSVAVGVADHPAADAIALLSALAKGLGSADAGGSTPSSPSGAGGGGSGGSGGGGCSMGSTPTTVYLAAGGAALAGCASAVAAVSLTNVFVAHTFVCVTQHVMDAAGRLAGSAAVRDAVGQFFQQLMHTLPFDMLRPYTEAYVAVCLGWMETVAELSRLLRCMFQYVNKAGARGVVSVARLTPLLWQRLCAVGELSAASPVVCMGVVSESARERVGVYKQFFMFLFSVSTWGCVAAVALMPPACWRSILQQLCHALTLPAEVELPKCALQVFEKLAQELTESVVAQAVAQHGDAVDVAADVAAGNLQACSTCLLQEALPIAVDALTSTTFDLDDAKSHIFMAEVLQLFRVSVARYGDTVMQVLYDRVAPFVGDAAAMECCSAVRDEPRVNAALKMKVRQLLGRVHAVHRSSQEGVAT